jgi:hypothetical protein
MILTAAAMSIGCKPQIFFSCFLLCTPVLNDDIGHRVRFAITLAIPIIPRVLDPSRRLLGRPELLDGDELSFR